MPEIKPYKGIRYNAEKVNLDEVVAPPYDVISPQLQSELYMRHPNNVVRLILNNASDPYSAARDCFEGWKKAGILMQDEISSIYFINQSFTVPGGKRSVRRGFVAACRLEEFGQGSVFPHEKTLSKPKEDRYKLFEATGAMFSQIFSLYPDPKRELEWLIAKATAGAPESDVLFDGVRNQLWRIDDPIILSGIQEFLRHQRVLVADGHHRYETALMYCNAHRMQNPAHTGKEAYNFVPMFFTNMHDPDLVILPTHRLVHDLPNYDRNILIKALEDTFEVEECSSLDDLLIKLNESTRPSFGLVTSDPVRFHVLRLRTPSYAGLPTIFNQLDVAILHTGVLRNILGISEGDQEKKLYLDYEKDAASAASAVQTGSSQAAFLMRPTRVEQVRMVAEAGFVMPQKSTFFYPKLLSGLVIYPFTSS